MDKNIIKEVSIYSKLIESYTELREKVIKVNKQEFLKAIVKKMGWNDIVITECDCTWSNLTNSIMIDVRIDIDPRARYVFSVDLCGKLRLCYREDFSKYAEQ